MFFYNTVCPTGNVRIRMNSMRMMKIPRSGCSIVENESAKMKYRLAVKAL
jgi:hypothetical protein